MKSIIFCLLILFGFVVSHGQIVTRPPANPSPRTADDARKIEFESRKEAMERLSREASEGAERSRTVKTLSRKEREKIKAIISPNPDDLAKHKDFLRQSKTGIFLLFPNFDCETRFVIRTDANCANFIPGIWSYSIRRETHSDSDFHDLSFENDSLSSRGLLNQSILVSLGDVPLENITLGSDGVKYLTSFEPAVTHEAARNQFQQINSGIKDGDFVYSNKIKAAVNNTYAMRLVAYRFYDKWLNRFGKSDLTAEDLKFYMLETDRRIDLTVAFRIIRKNSDGAVTILWKELEHKESPKMVYRKNEKLIDIKSGN